MAKIKVTSKCHFYDGMSITFKAPCDFSAIDGLKVKDPTSEKTFIFKDALGNTLTGIEHIFSKNAYVKVVLDTTNHFAYVQNGETPGYGVIKDETKPLYGLDKTASPDDIFKKIGLGGMNYVPTSVVDIPIFKKWELCSHLPIDPEKAKVWDLQYLDDAYYLLTQNTSASPYSIILWRSEDLVNWTQGATLREVKTTYFSEYPTYENRIFKINGKFVAVIQDRSASGSATSTGYTFVYYADSYNGTFTAASISGRDRSKYARVANGLLFLRSERLTTPQYYVYNVATDVYGNMGISGASEASRFDACYYKGSYYVTSTGYGNYYYGITYRFVLTESEDDIDIDIDTDDDLSRGGWFIPFNDDMLIWTINQSTGRWGGLYKLDASDLSASPAAYTPSSTNIESYYAVKRNGQLWFALSNDPEGDGNGAGFYTPADNDISSLVKVEEAGTFKPDGYSRPNCYSTWLINEEEQVISYNALVTKTTYKVIPKIIDYFGDEILLPGNQISGGLQITSGSYIGTGKYGSSNLNTLTFDFTPMLVVIFTSAGAHSFLMGGISKAKALASTSYYTASSSHTGTTTYSNWTVTWDTNSVSWYAEYSASHQFNTSGNTYSYIAVGM